MISSVVELFRRASEQHPDNCAIEIIGDTMGDRIISITYRDLAQKIQDCSKAICDILKPASRFCERCIAILDSDSVESVILQLALLSLGFSFITFSPHDRLEEFRFLFELRWLTYVSD